MTDGARATTIASRRSVPSRPRTGCACDPRSRGPVTGRPWCSCTAGRRTCAPGTAWCTSCTPPGDRSDPPLRPPRPRRVGRRPARGSHPRAGRRRPRRAPHRPGPRRAGRPRRALDGRHDAHGPRRAAPGSRRPAGARRRVHGHRERRHDRADPRHRRPRGERRGPSRAGARPVRGPPRPPGPRRPHRGRPHGAEPAPRRPALAGGPGPLVVGRRADREDVTVAAFRTSIAEHSRRRALEVLRGTPAVVLVGGRDRLCPPHHARAITAELPGAELALYPGAGHMITFERAPEVAAHLRGLLAAADSGPRTTSSSLGPPTPRPHRRRRTSPSCTTEATRAPSARKSRPLASPRPPPACGDSCT